MFDWILLPVPLLSQHSQWMSHPQVKSEPMLDSAQDTRLHRTVVILGSITRDAVSDSFSIPLCFNFGKMNRTTRFPKALATCLDHGGLGRTKRYASASQQLRTPCRFSFPSKTIFHSFLESRAF